MITQHLSLPKENSTEVQCKEEYKPIIESSDIQLKDEVEMQIDQYVDFILPKVFHTPRPLYFPLSLLLKRMTEHEVCSISIDKFEDQSFYFICHFETRG